MDEARERAGGLRPAQAGVVLDRGPHSAHLVATLVDLALRGHLRIESDRARNKAGWLLTRTRAASLQLTGSGDLVRYERRLLRGVFGRQREVRLARIARPSVNRVYTQLTREAFSYGWLDAETPQRRRMHTEADRIRTQLRTLRTDLTLLRPPADVDPVGFYSVWLPYAISFRIAPSWTRYTTLLAPPPPLAKDDSMEHSRDTSPWWSAAISTFPSPGDHTGGGHHGGGGDYRGGYDAGAHGGHHHGGFGGGGHGGGHGF